MEGQNLIQKLKNNLSEKTLLEDIDRLIKSKNLNYNASCFLTNLKNKGELNNLDFSKDFDYIRNYYIIASNEFKGDNKVAKLSYGLEYAEGDIFIYMKKDPEETLKYLKDYQNINPIDFNKYMKSHNSNNSINSELILKGGMNLYGYSFEFNVNYFIQTLSDLIELPDLAINLSDYFVPPNFKEVDISYYNMEQPLNKDMSLLRTGIYYKIFNNKISFEKERDFQIFQNSLIIGEVKTSFPKYIYLTGNKTSFEGIINQLFEKLFFFYNLYTKIGLFASNEIKNIELVFFYDNVQLKNINDKLILYFIRNNKYLWKIFVSIPIHFFIIYTLPSISNVSIMDLKNKVQKLEEQDKENKEEIQILKEQDKENKEEIQILKEQDKEKEKLIQKLLKEDKENKEEIQKLKEQNKMILLEIEKLKLQQNNEAKVDLIGIESINNKIEKEKGNYDDGGIFDFLKTQSYKENRINNDINEIINNNYFDFTAINKDYNNVNNNANKNYNNTGNNINNNNLGNLLLFD